MRRLAFIAALLLAGPAHADDIDCPPSIQVTPQTLVGNLPGWRIFTDNANTRYALESVTIYNGPPEDLSSLVPDNSNPDYSQWELFDNGVEHYFLTCGYAHTPVQLTRQLPSSLKRCRVAYSKDAGNADGTPSPYKIACE